MTHTSLRRGLMLKMNGELTWFKMKYIKLSNFCNTYGLLGHICRCCELYDPTILENHFALWLMNMKISRYTSREGKTSKLEKVAKGSKAKAQLKFDNSFIATVNIEQKLAIVRGEVSKQKNDLIVAPHRKTKF